MTSRPGGVASRFLAAAMVAEVVARRENRPLVCTNIATAKFALGDR